MILFYLSTAVGGGGGIQKPRRKITTHQHPRIPESFSRKVSNAFQFTDEAGAFIKYHVTVSLWEWREGGSGRGRGKCSTLIKCRKAKTVTCLDLNPRPYCSRQWNWRRHDVLRSAGRRGNKNHTQSKGCSGQQGFTKLHESIHFL